MPLFNIQLGEIVFGGVGAGLYGMLIFVLLAVFIAGLMVGRTPEYLGKKVQAFEVKMAGLVVLVLTLSILGFSRVGGRGQQLRRGRRHGRSDQRHEQQRAARVQRDPLRFLLGHRQQRQRVRGHQREHALVQHDDWPGRARRAGSS